MSGTVLRPVSPARGRGRTRAELEAELRDLRQRLQEAEATLHAIGNDDVDALVVHSRDKRQLQVLTIGSTQDAYGHLLESMPQGVLTLDETGTVLHASQRMLQMCGREHLVGRPAGEVFTDPGTVTTLVQNAGAEPLVMDASLRGEPGGAPRAVRLSATMLPLPGPRRLGVVVSHVEGPPSSRALLRDRGESASVTGFAPVLEQLPVGILLVDAATGHVTYANRRAEAILGRVLVGTDRPISHVELAAWRSDGSIMEGEQLPVARVLQGETIVREELARARSDGTLVYTRTTAGPLLDDEGKIEAILVALEDATSEHAARVEREESDRFRELFIGMLGHDLRDPLFALVTGITLLQRSEATDHQRGVLERMGRTTHRMTRMVDQLLDFTRARLGGGIPLNRAPAGLPDIVDRVVTELASSHPGTHIESVSDGLVLGEWDADRLEQVVANLVSNALKHGAPGRPIRVRVTEEGAMAHLTVQNEGPAIAPELLPHLFDPFRRGSASDRSGMGLGLYIAQQIVRAHGGTITVKSDAHGTSFFVRIPRLP